MDDKQEKKKVNPKLLIICGVLSLVVVGIYLYSDIFNPLEKTQSQITQSEDVNNGIQNNETNNATNGNNTPSNDSSIPNDNSNVVMEIPEVDLSSIEKLQGEDYRKSDDYINKAKQHGYYNSSTRLNPFIDKYYSESNSEENETNQYLKEYNLPKGQIFNTDEYNKELKDIN